MNGMTFEVISKGRKFYATIEEIHEDENTSEIIDIEFEVYNKGFKPVTLAFSVKQLNNIREQLKREIHDNLV